MNIIDSKQNNSQSGISHHSSLANINNSELKNKENEESKNQKILVEKEYSLNKKRQNNTNKDSALPLTINNSFKKSTDFLNLYFDEEEKNKKKQTIDMNTSYLTKLIMKPSGSNTKKNQEVNKNKEENNIPISCVNLFIAELDETKNNRDIRLNKNDSVKKENFNRNVIGNIEKYGISVEKNELLEDLSDIRSSNKKEETNLFSKKENENIQNIPKRNLEIFSEDFQNEILMNKKSEEKIEGKSRLLLSNEEINNISISIDYKNENKHSEKRREIASLASSHISEFIPNQPITKHDLFKISNLNSAANTNKTPVISNINRNESIISNLSGILKEMVKSDKEKTLKNQISETDFSLNAKYDKNNQDTTNSDKIQSKIEKIFMRNPNEKMDESEEEEIIDLNYNSYDSEFFKYDFQDKSYYDKPKNNRPYSKSKDDRHSHSKSIYDRSRERDREKEKEKEINFPYSKLIEKSSKKYGK